MRDVLRALRRRDELVDAAMRAHDAAWDEKHARFRERCADVQATLRARHADAIDRLRERLEDDSRVSAPSEWSPQLEEMRRSQRALVKKKRFGEALDLVKRLEELEEREEPEPSSSSSSRCRLLAHVRARAPRKMRWTCVAANSRSAERSIGASRAAASRSSACSSARASASCPSASEPCRALHGVSD